MFFFLCLFSLSPFSLLALPLYTALSLSIRFLSVSLLTLRHVPSLYPFPSSCPVTTAYLPQTALLCLSAQRQEWPDQGDAVRDRQSQKGTHQPRSVCVCVSSSLCTCVCVFVCVCQPRSVCVCESLSVRACVYAFSTVRTSSSLCVCVSRTLCVLNLFCLPGVSVSCSHGPAASISLLMFVPHTLHTL